MFDPSSALGRAARLPLKAIPKSAVFPVLSGPNKGRRWIVGAGRHGCWLGTYERQETEWFLSRLKPTSIVWDVGAHGGYFTLACSSRCSRVVACEPAPKNVNNLNRHIHLNGIRNVTVVPAAISGWVGFTDFSDAEDGYQNAIGRGQIRVETTTIDKLVEEDYPPPSIIKMDIEGGELDALNGALTTITTHHPNILLAVHSESLSSACRSLLEGLGYSVSPLNVATLWAEFVPRT